MIDKSLAFSRGEYTHVCIRIQQNAPMIAFANLSLTRKTTFLMFSMYENNIITMKLTRGPILDRLSQSGVAPNQT